MTYGRRTQQLTSSRALWILTTSLIFLNPKTHRFSSSTTSLRDVESMYPARAVVPMGHIRNTYTPESAHVIAPWDRSPPAPASLREPIIPDTSTDEDISLSSPARSIQDTQNVRTDNLPYVSPSIRQNTAPCNYVGPPSDTHQIDWSERSSSCVTNPSSVVIVSS
jgi:hypothetical protein